MKWICMATVLRTGLTFKAQHSVMMKENTCVASMLTKKKKTVIKKKKRGMGIQADQTMINGKHEILNFTGR